MSRFDPPAQTAKNLIRHCSNCKKAPVQAKSAACQPHSTSRAVSLFTIYTGAAADHLCKAKRKLWEVMKNVSKSLTELKIQELLNFVETKMQAIEGRGVQGGNARAPSGDLMWKSGSRAESCVQALRAMCSVQCKIAKLHTANALFDE